MLGLGTPAILPMSAPLLQIGTKVSRRHSVWCGILGMRKGWDGEMKRDLGVLALILGITLLIGSIMVLTLCAAMSHSEPQFTEPLAWRAATALLLGILLCCASWWCLKRSDGGRQK